MRLTRTTHAPRGLRHTKAAALTRLCVAADGDYSFIAAPLGDYTVTPRAKFYDFYPPSLTLSRLGESAGGADFAGVRQTYAILGQIHDQAGREAFNLPVGLSGDGGFETRRTTTDDAGFFSFLDAPAGLNYTVTPPEGGAVTFSARQVAGLNSDVFLNVSAVRRSFSVRGLVKDDVGPVGGATLKLDGVTKTATSASGVYEFRNVAGGLTYVVDASAKDHTFKAATTIVEDLEGDAEFDFDAVPNFVLSGRVRDAQGRGVFGVKVAVAGAGAQSAHTYTDADGAYSIAVTAHGDYTLAPASEQGYYTFAPSGANFTNVDGALSADFTATLSSVANPSYVLQFDSSSKSVDYAAFWPWKRDLGPFYWELWAMPGDGAGARYMISDGYGGAHALLFGFGFFGKAEPGRYQLFGDLWDGQSLTFFDSDQGPAPGEWGHFAVGWDGRHVVTYFDGVPVGRVDWSGPRRSPGPGGGGGHLFVGGSDHNNFVGRIAQVRGYEDANPRERGGPSSVFSSFRPQTVFDVDGNMLSWYFRPSIPVADLSRGFQGSPHPGTLRGWARGQLEPCFSCPLPEFVVDPSAPNFADPQNPGSPRAPVATPASAPAGALVFDSFSRRNSTYILNGLGGLGSTEAGSSGALAWRTGVAAPAAQPFGILNGLAVALADAAAVTWVDAGKTDLDVRVARHAGASGSGLDAGLSFRVVDSRNYFFAYTSEGASPSARVLTVGYYAGGRRTTIASDLSMPASWTTLRAVTNASGLVAVYADGARLYETQSTFLSNATGAGLYNSGPGLGLTNRWDNFTVYATPPQH
jgi:hypothetical protein